MTIRNDINAIDRGAATALGVPSAALILGGLLLLIAPLSAGWASVAWALRGGFGSTP